MTAILVRGYQPGGPGQVFKAGASANAGRIQKQYLSIAKRFLANTSDAEMYYAVLTSSALS
jgi:hypothetical protein